MFSEVCEVDKTQNAVKSDLANLERQIDGFLDRIVETNSAVTIKAYERKIDTLEKERLATEDKLANSGQPTRSFDEIIELRNHSTVQDVSMIPRR